MGQQRRWWQAGRGWVRRAGAAVWAGAMAGSLVLGAGPARATAYAQVSGGPYSQDLPGPFIDFDGPAPRFASAETGGGAPLHYDGQGSFSSAASASLASGSIRAASRIITSGHGLFVAYASGSLSDSLWVSGNAPVEVELRMEVQGSFQGLGFGTFSASGYLELGGAASYATLQWDTSSQRPVRLSRQQGTVVMISSDPASVISWITVRQTLLPGVPVSVYASMGIGSSAADSSEINNNFAHTAQLWLGLPEGTLLQSGSGVFLTEPPLPVPEPATWVLWLLALAGGLLWCRRRAATLCLAGLTCWMGMGALPAQAQTVVRAEVLALNHLLDLDVGIAGPTRASAEASFAQGDALYGYAGYGAAYADLRRGALGTVVQADDFAGGSGSGPFARFEGRASFSDDVQFSHDGVIAFSLGISGSFRSQRESVFGAHGQLSLSPAFSAPQTAAASFSWQNSFSQPQAALHTEGDVSGISATPAALFATLRVVLPVQAGQWLRLDATLNVDANPFRNDQAHALFNHTAQLGLQMPAGMTMTSASGVLLSAAPVPEPATTALWAAGLLWLAWRRLRRAVGRLRATPRRAAAAMLLGLAAQGPARAALQADTILSVDTLVQSAGTAPVFDGWTAPLPGLPFVPPWVRSIGRSGGAQADAVQAVNGYFEVQARLDSGWSRSPGLSLASASSDFILDVQTSTPDAPLVLDFLLHGSAVSGSVYYSEGLLTARAGVRIAVSWDLGPWETVWALQDTVLLDSAASGSQFQHQVSSTDVQGVGLPAIAAEYFGWQQFALQGMVQRSAFTGTLDFGLLQPGQTFSLLYQGLAEVEADTRYASTALAWLEDPFALRSAAPALRLNGLLLPTVNLPPVPEPGGVWLLLAGLPWLLLRVRVRRRR